MASKKKEEKELEKKEAEKAPESLAPDTQADGKEAENAPEEKAVKKTKKEVEEDAHADALLKLYPQYAELYIDSKGGVFTPATPAHIRGNARLYKNKYHK